MTKLRFARVSTGVNGKCKLEARTRESARRKASRKIRAQLTGQKKRQPQRQKSAESCQQL